MNSGFLARFPRQLRYWTICCLISAAPSLLAALIHLGMADKPVAISALHAAIATLIALYSTLGALYPPLHSPTHLLSRTLNHTLKIRALLSIATMLLLLHPIAAVLSPDVWCAVITAMSFIKIAELLHNPFSAGALQQPGFLLTYALSIVQGLLVSGVFATMGFFVLLAIQSKDRKQGRVLGTLLETPGN